MDDPYEMSARNFRQRRHLPFDAKMSTASASVPLTLRVPLEGASTRSPSPETDSTTSGLSDTNYTVWEPTFMPLLSPCVLPSDLILPNTQNHSSGNNPPDPLGAIATFEISHLDIVKRVDEGVVGRCEDGQVRCGCE